MSIDLEYAIKKDIRNNPVVREIDRAQKREFVRTVALVTAIVGMLLFSATQPFKMVSSGYGLERLRQQLAEEESIRRKLILEIETWRAPELLERRAIRELGMTAPASDEMIVLELVPAPSVAGRAVIADARQDR